jgi:DNA-3-methyladenine glycosylase I
MARVNAETARCPWTGNDALYTRYHDEEWGVPHCDSDRLFEKLILEGFQSGLSWITILRKRENFRKAFDGFDAEKIARYGARDVRRLMMDEGIVRNRLKIEAAIDNARAYLTLSERQPLSRFIWDFLDSKPRINAFRSMSQIPSQTVDSERISKALKNGGFRFVGPTTVYAFMQSSGMVNDHLVSCPRHEACAKLQRRFKL